MPLQLIDNIADFRRWRAALDPKFSVGFVPTMGALHLGHISLIEAAKNQSDIVVCSIFVNPTQFTNPDDLLKYPRSLAKDQDLLVGAGAHVLFLPTASDMYGQEYMLKFDFGVLENTMEGEFRPGHFNGVALVVSKLFHLVKPHKAFFGQKDLQQVAVIKDLVNALSFEVEVLRCPTVRSEKGLALSSRNQRLSQKELEEASIIYQTQLRVISELKNGQLVEDAIENGIRFFRQTRNYNLEYLQVVYADTLLVYTNEETKKELAVCIAAPFGSVRLIDNVIFTLD
jgi:pantoate--beta-alanine ligase